MNAYYADTERESHAYTSRTSCRTYSYLQAIKMEATLDERTLKRIQEIYDESIFELLKGSCNILRRNLTNFERIDEKKIQFHSEVLYINELICEDKFILKIETNYARYILPECIHRIFAKETLSWGSYEDANTLSNNAYLGDYLPIEEGFLYWDNPEISNAEFEAALAICRLDKNSLKEDPDLAKDLNAFLKLSDNKYLTLKKRLNEYYHSIKY